MSNGTQSLFLAMPSFRFIKAYLDFQIQSKSEYKIHSPFVFNFFMGVLKNRDKEDFFEAIESERNSLLKSRDFIEVEDMGAGTGRQGVLWKQRSLADIARKALKPPYLARILGRLAKFVKAGTIIELGTSLGITTSYLSLFNPDAEILTLEGSPEIARMAGEVFTRLGLKNVQVLVGNFDTKLPDLLKIAKKSPRLMYIDGNHRYEPTLRYFELFMKDFREEDVLVFDDIHWSEEMEKAWKEIKQDPRVSLSLDLFYLGVVFLNANRAKSHFRLHIF